MAQRDDLRILVPVDVSESDPHPLATLDLLAPIDVVLLGYFPVPDQAEPALIRDEYEAAAEATLVELADDYPDLTEVLVFTHDRDATIDRIAAEHDCDAVLSMGDVTAIDSVLVALRGDVNLDRIVSVAARVLQATGATATLFHSVTEDADESYGEFLLQGATDRFVERGVDADRIDWALDESGDPQQAIVDTAAAHDIVVLGESEPSLVDRIVGELLAPILDELDRPSLVVRDLE